MRFMFRPYRPDSHTHTRYNTSFLWKSIILMLRASIRTVTGTVMGRVQNVTILYNIIILYWKNHHHLHHHHKRC
jgi:hypothetical protein